MGWVRERMIEEAREKGQEAQRAGAPLSDNPFSQAEERQAWALGYLSAENENAKKAS